MNNDPLAPWRRQGQSAPTPAPEGGTLKKYEAFGEGSGNARLWFKYPVYGDEPDRAFPYGYLTSIVTDNWSLIGMTFSIPFPRPTVITLHGECMGDVAAAIIQGTASWVQVFDPKAFVAPPDGIAIIRGITLNELIPERKQKH